MGSGLILLLIVVAWLAVLVPMAVKTHDTSASLTSVDKFNDAMKVLSGRSPRDRRDIVMPRRPADLQDTVPMTVAMTMAERRRRTLLVLLGSALLTLGLVMLGLGWLLVPHILCDLLLVAFVVHCRRQAVLKAQRNVRRRTAAPPTAIPKPRVAGIPDRMPARPVPLSAPLPAPAARYDDAAVAVMAPTGTDNSWSPVPVPVPTYVGKAVAPSRPPRVLDLTKPGEWAATLEGPDIGLDILGDEHELEHILDRRRAVNDW